MREGPKNAGDNNFGQDYLKLRTKFKNLFLVIVGEQVFEGDCNSDIKVTKLASEFMAFNFSDV